MSKTEYIEEFVDILAQVLKIVLPVKISLICLHMCSFVSVSAAGPVHAGCEVPRVFKRHSCRFCVISLFLFGAGGKCLG